jgi:subtilisin family serine protease
MKYIIFLASFIFFAGCSKGFQALKSAPSQNGQNCKKARVQSKPASFQSVFAFSKIDHETLTSVNSDVILTVDNNCLSERGEANSNFPLTQSLKWRKKNKFMSAEDSYHFVLPVGISNPKLENLANNDECVIGVSRNIVSKIISVPNDPNYSQQKQLAAIHHADNYDFYFSPTTGIQKDAVIAIIDNGVDITHQDLADHLWVNLAEKNGVAGVDDDGNGYVDDVNGYDFASDVGNPNHKYPNDNNAGHTHGTHVAGLAAAVSNNSLGVAGVMSQHSKIMALNVFGNSDAARTDNIDSAIRYAADMGANVINMSLGGPGSAASTQQALQYAVSKGVLVVVAAGNDGGNPNMNNGVMTSTNFYTPASYGASISGMITIGASDANPNSLAQLCSFSNRSPTYVELAAPGCDTSRTSMGILSTYRGDQYGYMAGTSMASPVAAGFGATIWSYVKDHYQQTLTPAELETLLEEGSQNFSSLNAYIKNGKNIDFSTLKDKITTTFTDPNDDCTK